MKRIVLAISLIFLAAAGFSQDTPLDQIADGLQTFTNGIAPSIPLNSTTGSTWSDAYIGQLLALPPHFGIGATVGVTFIPASFLTDMFDTMEIDAADTPGIDTLAKVGIPLPAAVVNARVGGFILPFDIGFKVGTIPQEAKDVMGDFALEYLLVGGDVRYAIFDEKKNIIDLSVGLGVNYLATSLSVPLDIGAVQYPFTDPTTDTDHTIGLSNPTLFLDWSTVTVDLSAQVSKRIIFFTPYAGLGLTIGKPKVQTGLKSVLLYDGTEMTEDQEAALNELYDALDAAGLPLPVDPESLTEGYIFESNITRGTDLRIYGGLSLDIFIVRIDLNALYSFVGRNLGANLGIRVQL